MPYAEEASHTWAWDEGVNQIPGENALAKHLTHGRGMKDPGLHGLVQRTVSEASHTWAWDEGLSCLTVCCQLLEASHTWAWDEG